MVGTPCCGVRGQRNKIRSPRAVETRRLIAKSCRGGCVSRKISAIAREDTRHYTIAASLIASVVIPEVSVSWFPDWNGFTASNLRNPSRAFAPALRWHPKRFYKDVFFLRLSLLARMEQCSCLCRAMKRRVSHSKSERWNPTFQVSCPEIRRT